MCRPTGTVDGGPMNRFLNLASKALAVVGVLTLMWTAGGMQSAKADINPWIYPWLPTCMVEPISGTHCIRLLCDPGECCCLAEGPTTTVLGTFCCSRLCSPCV